MKFKFDFNSTPNFGRFRLKDPSLFSRMWTRHDSEYPGISYIIGNLQDGKYATQAIRFDRSLWTEKRAASWWKKNSHRFTLKVRKNPNESLSWYLKTFNREDLRLPTKISAQDKKKIVSSESLYDYVGKFKSGQIYLCHAGGFLYGVIEIYPHTTEYHDFRNKVHEFNNKPNLDSLNNFLYDYFIKNI